MSTGEIVKAAWQAMAGVNGAMALAIESKRPLSRAAVLQWVVRLRKAADMLEEIFK